MFVFAKVLMLHKFIILSLPIIASSSVPTFFIMNEKIDTTNSSNITANCHPKIAESASKLIFELMSDKITHVIDLHIWTEPVNNTRSKSRVLPGVKWANEIGRTLITLITLAEKYDNIMLLSYTSTMKAGTYGLNIVVAEEAMRCFSSKENSSDNALFDFLVYQLDHISGRSNGDYNYKLCRPHNDKYNCCTIIGPNDSLICSDYSSIVTKMLPIFLLVTIIFALYVFLPATLENFGHFQCNDKYYKIFKSPMSLSSVLYSVLIQGRGTVKSSGRRWIFAAFVIVVTLPEYSSSLFIYYMIFACPWLTFLIVGDFNFDEQSLFDPFKHSIEVITFPFNLIWWWTKCKKLYACCCCISQSTHHVQLEDNNQEDDKQLGIIERAAHRFFFLASIVWYILVIPISLFVTIFILLYDNLKYAMNVVALNSKDAGKPCISKDAGKPCILYFIMKCICFGLFIAVTYVAVVFSMLTMFPLVFCSIIGLFLNGEIYNPYILPLCTILFYSWTNWRSSVETKYLVLITTIYKVCEECPVTEIQQVANSDIVIDISSEDTTPRPELFTIKLDDHGELIIPKKLYDAVKDKFMPYDRILFHYFQGVLFVIVFAYLLYIVMALAQESAISGSVQVIGSIAATSLPFIFDFVWKKNSDEQKEADSCALKSKLKRILLVREVDDRTGQMVVELTPESYAVLYGNKFFSECGKKERAGPPKKTSPSEIEEIKMEPWPPNHSQAC